MRFRLAALMLTLLTLSACGASEQTPHQPRNTDPLALSSKLRALMADECYTADAKQVYPRCGKFFTELVGTANAIKDVLPDAPKRTAEGSQQIDSGIAAYNQHSCGPMDQQPQPSMTQPCSQALAETRDGLRLVYNTLYIKK